MMFIFYDNAANNWLRSSINRITKPISKQTFLKKRRKEFNNVIPKISPFYEAVPPPLHRKICYKAAQQKLCEKNNKNIFLYFFSLINRKQQSDFINRTPQNQQQSVFAKLLETHSTSPCRLHCTRNWTYQSKYF